MGVNRTAKTFTLGAALREARLAAGHGNLRKFADLIDVSPSGLSRWETGDRTPRPEDVARILTVLGVTGQRYEQIMTMTRDPGASSWLAVSLPERQQHLDALLRFERDADKITSVSPLIITGLLQTPEYVRAIMTGGGVPEDEIETRIRIRLGRREILQSAHLTALIGEAALRQQIGGPAVLSAQLRHLLAMADQVDLRVLPFTTGWNPSLEGGWTVIESEEAPTVIHLENRRSGLILHEEEDVAAYRVAADSAKEAAMSPEASVELIAEVIKGLEIPA